MNKSNKAGSLIGSGRHLPQAHSGGSPCFGCPLQRDTLNRLSLNSDSEGNLDCLLIPPAAQEGEVI